MFRYVTLVLLRKIDPVHSFVLVPYRLIRPAPSLPISKVGRKVDIMIVGAFAFFVLFPSDRAKTNFPLSDFPFSDYGFRV